MTFRTALLSKLTPRAERAAANDAADLIADDVTIAFGGLLAIRNVNLRLARHEILGLIGPNGAGKTTLVNCFTGFQKPSSGEIRIGCTRASTWKPERFRKAGISRTFQAGRLFRNMTVLENVEVTAAGLGQKKQVSRRLALEILDHLSIADKAQTIAGALPYTDERRVGIARALVVPPIYGARPKTIDLWSSLGEQLHFGAVRIPRLEVVTIGVTLVLLAALTAFLKRTRYGVQIRAAAEDFLMARYLGVRANLAIGVAFALSGILAAVVSLLFVSETGTLTNVMGVPLMLYAFIATVVGGMGSLVGAVVGGYTVGFLAVMLQAYLPDGLRSFRDAFVFATIVFVLLLRPAGIIPTKALVQRV